MPIRPGSVIEVLPLPSTYDSGYILARMACDIVLSPQAIQDWRSPPAHLRPVIRQAMERHLRHRPEHISRSRIKRLRGLALPQYRLRVGDIRVFYDVRQGQVQVLAIVAKSQAKAWLDQEGITDEAGSPL